MPKVAVGEEEAGREKERGNEVAGTKVIKSHIEQRVVVIKRMGSMERKMSRMKVAAKKTKIEERIKLIIIKIINSMILLNSVGSHSSREEISITDGKAIITLSQNRITVSRKNMGMTTTKQQCTLLLQNPT